MAAKTGYLVVNLKDLTEMTVYTYKKGVEYETGATRREMEALGNRTMIGNFLIIKVDIKGFNRKRGRE